MTMPSHHPDPPAEPDADRAPWERFACGAMGTSHHAHLRLAYESLRLHDALTVLPHVERALRALATAHGQPQKVHVTLTALWLFVVQERMAREPVPASFEALLAGNPDLLDARGLPQRYYSEAALADPLARRTFVLPDRGHA